MCLRPQCFPFILVNDELSVVFSLNGLSERHEVIHVSGRDFAVMAVTARLGPICLPLAAEMSVINRGRQRSPGRLTSETMGSR